MACSLRLYSHLNSLKRRGRFLGWKIFWLGTFNLFLLSLTSEEFYRQFFTMQDDGIDTESYCVEIEDEWRLNVLNLKLLNPLLICLINRRAFCLQSKNNLVLFRTAKNKKGKHRLVDRLSNDAYTPQFTLRHLPPPPHSTLLPLSMGQSGGEMYCVVCAVFPTQCVLTSIICPLPPTRPPPSHHPLSHHITIDPIPWAEQNPDNSDRYMCAFL